ncbi:MAG: cupin [Verrucomicrobia bacterium]|nr:cupin [Verrucomicrobiota bacterium]
MNPEAETIIRDLGLEPLQHEGGFFRRTWTSVTRLPDGRAASSSILFLITPEGFSALHRLRADELWHFHAGDAVEHILLDPRDHSVAIHVLGSDLLAGQRPQLVVPGGTWQGARLVSSDHSRGWALLGCTVTPAWDEAEFDLGDRATLLRDFPWVEKSIRALTRERRSLMD